MRINKILSLSVVILLITVVFAGVVPAAAQYDTMQFRYNAQHTGDYSPAGANMSNGQLLWKYATSGGVVSSPAVAHGVVYVGSFDGNVYALNATTGEKLWNYTTGGAVGDPAVVNGVVYVASDDNIYAINATTGTQLWNYTTLGAASDPAVVNGIVYVSAYVPGENQWVNGTVYAINATTGTQLWNYTTLGGEDTSPAVANGVVYVGSNSYGVNASNPYQYPYYSTVYSLNATTGAYVSSYSLPIGWVSSAPAVADGVVYVETFSSEPWYSVHAEGAFYATDWSLGPTSFTTYSSPAISNGVAYLTVCGVNDTLYALNATTGTQLWNTTAAGDPVVANGVVYAENGNEVTALNASTGANVWNYTTGGVESSPAVVNGVVYVGSDDGNIYAIGTQSEPTPVTPASSPAATGNYLFVRGSDSALWYNYWNGTTWTAAASLGGQLASAPAATSSGGVINVFVQGTTGAVYEKTTTNNGTTWSGWVSLGGVLAANSAPAATSSGGVINVFVHGTDNALWYKTSTNNGASWSAWHSLSGVLAASSSPAATSPGTGQADVLVHGTDNALWYKTTTNGGTTWSGWKSLGGVLAADSSPAATSPANGAMDVFAQGTTGAVYEKTTTNNGASWGGWTSLGGVLMAGSSPAATSENGQVYVFALGTNNSLLWRTYSNGAWLPWTTVGM
ncbi:MAG: PQQ-binding-like beta-propeller repeat protein [Halobacteriota archaeon]